MKLFHSCHNCKVQYNAQRIEIISYMNIIKNVFIIFQFFFFNKNFISTLQGYNVRVFDAFGIIKYYTNYK